MPSRIRVPPPIALALCGFAFAWAPLLTTATAEEIPAQTPAEPPAAADDSTAWPLAAPYDGGTLRVYQPQPETLSGDRLLARAAFSVVPAGEGAQPAFGVLWVAAHVDIDREQRTLTLANEAVTRVQLAGADAAAVARISTAADLALQASDHELSLDRILATLEVAESERQDGDAGLSTVAPTIHVVERPTLLLALDGPPEGEPLPGSTFERIVNTPQLVARDPASGTFYLADEATWYRAPAITGPWAVAPTLDAATAAALAPLTAAGGTDVAAPPAADGGPVDILASTVPAELVSLAGQPQYEPIADTGLLGVANTENDLFEDPEQNLHYTLISGRWFRTAALRGGTWEHVPGRALPPGFARIPSDSRYARVLAHVPGTPAAAEAVADAQLPQTAAVRRDATVTITYDGEPQFEPITGTALSYAINTPSQVLKTADGQCYNCTQGVWYHAAMANGPWVVSTTVPAEVSTIPPGSPAYNLRYAYVYDSTDDAVYVGYAPGYLGTYIFDGVVVWGTGFTYHGGWRHHYYPHPWTYGFGMAYNPWTGHWGSGFHGGPRGGWPAEGTVGFHGGWLGPAGYHPTFTPRSVRSAAAEQRAGGVARPGPAVHPPLYDNLYRNPANHARVVAGSAPARPTRAAAPGVTGARAPAAPRERVTTDREGGVYRRNGNAWEQWQHTGWAPLHGEPAQPRVAGPVEAHQPEPGERPHPPTHGEGQPPVTDRPRPATPEAHRPGAPGERQGETPHPPVPGEGHAPTADRPRPATPEELHRSAPTPPPVVHEPREPVAVPRTGTPPVTPPREPAAIDRGQYLERQQRAEERGAQREQQFRQYRGNPATPPAIAHPAPAPQAAPAPAPHASPTPSPGQHR